MQQVEFNEPIGTSGVTMAGGVLFVCTGNICRSPLAEDLARQMYRIPGLVFRSAGVRGLEGHGASPESRVFAAGRGGNLEAHVARQVDRESVADMDWIIGMTRTHAAICKNRLEGFFDGAIGCLGFPGQDLRQQPLNGSGEEVPDPYGLNQDAYDDCGRQIERLLTGWEPVFRSLTASKED